MLDGSSDNAQVAIAQFVAELEQRGHMDNRPWCARMDARIQHLHPVQCKANSVGVTMATMLDHVHYHAETCS